MVAGTRVAKMYVAKRSRRIGGWSALLAAYALVLNALLATSLLAATPAGKSLSGFELCSAVTDTTSEVDHTDSTTKRAAIHCQICLQHATPAALPPPVAITLVVPIANVAAIAAVVADATAVERHVSNHSPRGPPG